MVILNINITVKFIKNCHDIILECATIFVARSIELRNSRSGSYIRLCLLPTLHDFQYGVYADALDVLLYILHNVLLFGSLKME